jgi:hypothetical protein
LRIVIILISFLSITCNQSEVSSIDLFDDSSKGSIEIDGLSFVAPPNPFPSNPMAEVKAINADWIALIPYAYTPKDKPILYYNIERQWWGEKVIGILESIRLAKEAKIKILLKPQVYVPGGWTGSLDYSKDKDWEKWEMDYTKYILEFAQIAEEHKLEMFCIGTEFKISVQKRPEFWKNLIDKIRSIYDGKLVYAANWDCYQKIPFWKELDYVGIDAYFPLLKDKIPSVKALEKSWDPIVEEMNAFYKRIEIPILFTEFGYMSLEGCAYNTWELEGNRNQTPMNELAQANALNALLNTFKEQEWWRGGFLWKWFPNMQGH